MKYTLIIFCLISFTLSADMVILKNDTVLIGRYISEQQDDTISFQVFKETMKIKKTNIKKFELGYSGVPLCYKKTKDWSEICGEYIHQLDRHKMILGKGDGLLEKEEIDLSNLSKISIKKTKKDERLLFTLRLGIVVTIKSADKFYKGEIKNVNNISLTINDEKAGNKVFTEIEIEEISWERKTDNYFAFAKYIIPGVMQYQNGKKLKGLIMGTLFFGFIGGAASQYTAAKNAIDSDVDYIIIGNSIYVGSNLNPNPQYEKANQNMQYSLGGLGLLYAFHSYEVYSHISKSGVKTSLKVNAFPNNNTLYSSSSYAQPLTGNQSIEFNISYQF